MSIATPNTAIELVGRNGDHTPPPPSSKRKGKPRGRYKPRLATNIKVALEEVVAKSISARRWMGLVLDWVEEEREITKADIEALVDLAPITAIANGMYQDRLNRLGELDHYMARLALEVTAIETELSEALESSRAADTVPAGDSRP
jgi:hypothetical protein